ncbi:Druantia anti-phage system protein DruA [Candidatus Kuenenia stuttgartensis]|uniref:Druantia anti-phage system protein DruA n=1 Tax=Kuenenia stuttgartiensis TaxID=174633 RepID=UPI001469B0F9
MESRDEWIGWTEEARKRNHTFVINNSRYLIAPTVRVKCLASHVLAKCQTRLVDDWERVYKYRPVLLKPMWNEDGFSEAVIGQLTGSM